MYLNGMDFSKVLAIRILHALPQTKNLEPAEYREAEDIVTAVLQESFEEDILEEEYMVNSEEDIREDNDGLRFEPRLHGDSMLEACLESMQALSTEHEFIKEEDTLEPSAWYKFKSKYKVIPCSDSVLEACLESISLDNYADYPNNDFVNEVMRTKRIKIDIDYSDDIFDDPRDYV